MQTSTDAQLYKLYWKRGHLNTLKRLELATENELRLLDELNEQINKLEMAEVIALEAKDQTIFAKINKLLVDVCLFAFKLHPDKPVLKASEICAALTTTDEPDIHEIISAALIANRIEPLFTVNGLPENWTVDLMSLRKQWILEDGNAIDGTDPKNILVGFRLVVQHEAGTVND